MTSLFISHSGKDRAHAERVAERLRASGYQSVFLDVDPEQGLPVGSFWERELYHALRRADGLIFLASAASTSSRWCFAEVALARSMAVPVLPICIEPTPPLSLLGDVQMIEFDGSDAAFDRLRRGLHRAGLDAGNSFGWDPARSPYPGLHAFSAADAAVFFGRDGDIRRLVKLLQPTLLRGAGRWVGVIGPSGSGKSSLMNAGLVPRLAREPERWTILPTMVPGSRPTRHLAVSLAEAFTGHRHPHSADDIERRLTAESATGADLQALCRDLADSAAGPSRNVLVVIDQAEELVTLTGPAEQRRFLALLRDALADDSPVWVVCTLRAEFLATSPERAGLAEVMDDTVVLEPLGRGRLAEVVTRPARYGGFDFQPGLVERIVEDATGGDALPLLAYTLSELAKKPGPDRVVTFADYDAVGGVVGALTGRADALAADLTRRGHGSALMPPLLRLVTVDSAGRPGGRRVRRADLSAQEREVIDAFVEARLLSSGTDGPGGDDGAGAVVAVAHEALLRQWPPLRAAIDASQVSLRLHAEVERAAADWHRGDRDESYLIGGSRLAQLLAWRDTDQSPLGAPEQEFLDACQELADREASEKLRAARRANRRLRVFLAVASTLLLVAAGLGVTAGVEAGRARAQAEAALVRQLMAEAASVRPDQPDLALLLGVEALHRASGPNREQARIALLDELDQPFHRSTQLFDTGFVWTVAFSPDGRTVASAGQGPPQLWDVASGRPRGGPLLGHSRTVNRVVFNRDGSLLATASVDGTARLWDTATGSQHGPTLVGHLDSVSSVAFSPDASLLATSSEDGRVRLWDVATGTSVGDPLVGPDKLWDVTFRPDGKMLAAACADGTVQLWDVATRRSVAVLRGHTASVRAVAFSPDGTLLASGALDNTIRLWDVATRTQRGAPLTGHTGAGVYALDINRAGTTIASAGRDKTVRLWDVAQAKQIGAPLSGHTSAVTGVAFSPDGQTVASASYDKTVRLWQTTEARPATRALHSHDQPVGLAFSPDGRIVATAESQSGEQWGQGQLWDPVTGEPRGTIPADGGFLALLQGTRGPDPGATRQLDTVSMDRWATSPDGTTVAGRNGDGTITLWDTGTARPRGRPVPAGASAETGLVFSQDGKTMAWGDDHDSVTVWPVGAERSQGRTLSGHSNIVRGLAFSPDATTLASASYDGTVRLWDVTAGRPRGNPLVGHASAVMNVVFSPDGATLASVGDDGTVRLWDVPTGQPIGTALAGHSGSVNLVAFSPDGSMLATASSDGTVLLWNLGADALVVEACASTNRNVSQAEWKAFVGADAYHRTCPAYPDGP